MWLFVKDAFLSIVKYAEDPTALLVRARIKGDIERVFPNAKVKKTPSRDYLFRAVIPREEVAQAVARQAMQIDYGNFKDSVADADRHNAYMKCWSAMWRLQEQRLKQR
jgi:hypothetical protein